MSMEPHVDTHPFDFERAFSCIGVVKNVVCKDDPRNTWGEVTLYDVTAFLQWPPTSSDLELLPYAGQQAGGANSSEDPLLVGQRVVIEFPEGDINRPQIQKPFMSNEPLVGQTSDEHPHVRHLRNGVLTEIDKDGDVKISDFASSATLVEFAKVGGSYTLRFHGTVEVGGDLTGLKKLIHEEAAAVYNGHTHQVTVPGGGAGGIVTSTGPSASIGAGHMTSDTKAK